jgi:Icc-related predicted phosphoesterase
VRILAFSDLHRDTGAAQRIVEASAQADIIIGAGDFATCGEGAMDTLDILRYVRVPAVLVPGNHDNPIELRNLCEPWASSHVLHGDLVEIRAFTFFGLGGEIPCRNSEPWNTALSEDEAEHILRRCPANAVLITHTPPYGCADLQRSGAHEGSRAIRAAIDEKQPLLNLCGHIHFAWGHSATLGTTRVHNLGPEINWFEI